MDARSFYDIWMKRDSTIGTVELMETYAKQSKIELLESILEDMVGCNPEYHYEILKEEFEQLKDK